MSDASLPTEDGQLRLPTLRTLIVASIPLVVSWAIANAMRRPVEAIIDISVTRHIVLSGTIPWCLQFVATLLVVKSCWRSRLYSGPAIKFAAVTTATIGIVWWVGVALTYQGQDPLEAISQTTITSIEQQFAGEPLPFVLVHRICGPLISIGQLRGLLSLAGTGFFHSLATLSLLTGYLTYTASVCHVGHKGRTTTRDVIRFILMVSVVFVPVFVRLVVDASRAAP